MADPRICSVDGCGKVVVGRGWCGMHYARWRKHGDPLGGRAPNGEAMRYFREVVLAYDGGECLIWPYQRDKMGYGRLDTDGRNQVVSHLVCAETHGPRPTPKHHAAHSCGNGRGGCVAKRHLTWKTPKENQADMVAHGRSTRGERQPNAKLTNGDARKILALKGKLSQQKIADMFSVSRATVGLLHQRKTWKEL